MYPTRSTRREERARRRAEEALERGNRELATMVARGRASAVEEREVLDRDHQGGMGGGMGDQGGRCGRQVGTRRRGACVALDQDEVEVLEVVVAAHGNQAIEEIREAAEEEIVEEVGPADLAVGEVVELEEEEDLEEVDGESEVEHIGVDEADIEQQREQSGHVGEDLVEGADDDQVAQDVHAELEVAQMVEVDGSADSPLSDTIDLTDSPAPSQRCFFIFPVSTE